MVEQANPGQGYAPRVRVMWRRARIWVGLGATLAVTVAIRLPTLLSARYVDFDEGVYGVSVLAMRDGGEPFRDVFSSQGPLFLPMLWLFDVAGLRHFQAVRLGMILTALAFTLGVYVIARRVAGEGGTLVALVAAAVVGTAGAGVSAAGVIHSDGLALAFSVWAVAVALGAGSMGRWRCVVVGLLLGASAAVKSAFVVPAAVAVLWHYARRREWRDLGIAAGCAALLGLAVSLPWGLGNVWDQFVVFQLEAPRDRAWWPNITGSASRLWDRDPIFLLFAAVGLIGLAVRLVRRRWPAGDRSAYPVILVWLAATVALLVFGLELDRGSYRFLVFLMVPAMVAFAAIRPPLVAVAVLAALLLVPMHLDGYSAVLKRQHLTSIHRDVVARLDALPVGANVVTDNPGLAWVAGRHPPPRLVDPSWARILSGNLEADAVLAGTAQDDVCAVLFYTHRFDYLDRNLPEKLVGYTLVMDWDEGRRLYVKDACG